MRTTGWTKVREGDFASKWIREDAPSGGIQPCARSEDVAYYRVMPELSRFFGIIIRMFSEAGMSHHVAHFHAYTQDFKTKLRSSRLVLWNSLPGRFRRSSAVLSRHGRNCIKQN